MATSYYSDHVVLNAAGTNTIEPKYHDSAEVAVVASYTWAAAFVINDIIYMMDIPANVYITGWLVDSTQIDSSTGLTIDIGDAASATRWASAVTTIGRAASGSIVGPAATGLSGVLGYTTTANYRVQVKIHAAPTTAVTTGTLVMRVSYTANP